MYYGPKFGHHSGLSKVMSHFNFMSGAQTKKGGAHLSIQKHKLIELRYLERGGGNWGKKPIIQSTVNERVNESVASQKISE